MREQRERQMLGLAPEHDSEDEDDFPPMIAPAAAPSHHISHDHHQQRKSSAENRDRRETKQNKTEIIGNNARRCSGLVMERSNINTDTDDSDVLAEDGDDGIAGDSGWLVLEFDDDMGSRLSNKRAASLSPSELLLPGIIGTQDASLVGFGPGIDAVGGDSDGEWGSNWDEEDEDEDEEDGEEEDEDEEGEEDDDTDSVTFAACPSDCECACCRADDCPAFSWASARAIRGRVRV